MPNPIAELDSEASAVTGIRLALLSRFDEMWALRDYALDWSDPEGVHQMRVASRRLRSATRDFIPYVRRRRLSASLQQVRAIADALGRVRDQDVAIAALEVLTPRAPELLAAGISELTDARKEIRKEARAALIETLERARVAEVQANFATVIDQATAISARSKRVKQVSYRQAAREVVLTRLKELEQLSNSLYQPLKVGPLHRLRIAAKRLRYALELFEEVWGPPMLVFSKRVGGLQSSLGELHDCDVWIGSIGATLTKVRRMETALSLPAEQTDASFWLLSHFIKRRTRHLRSALTKWQKWEGDNLSIKIREALEAGPRSTMTAAYTSDA